MGVKLDKESKELKSNIKIYVIVWSILIIAITVMYITDGKYILPISALYVLWLVIIFHFESYRFTKYISKYHPKVIKEKKWVSPAQNYFIWRNFINSNGDIDDPDLIEIKKNLKSIILFNILQILTIPIIVLLVKIIEQFIY